MAGKQLAFLSVLVFLCQALGYAVESRLLPFYPSGNAAPFMNPYFCSGMCIDFELFGLTNKTHCYCGNFISSNSSRTVESDCTERCLDGSPCGTLGFMSVYSTGTQVTNPKNSLICDYCPNTTFLMVETTTLYCMDVSSCAQTNVVCTNGSTCNVLCKGDWSCTLLSVTVDSTSTLNMICDGPILANTCANLNIKCSGKCNVQCKYAHKTCYTAIGTTSPLGKAANLPFDVTSVVRFFGRNNLTILDFLISLQGFVQLLCNEEEIAALPSQERFLKQLENETAVGFNSLYNTTQEFSAKIVVKRVVVVSTKGNTSIALVSRVFDQSLTSATTTLFKQVAIENVIVTSDLSLRATLVFLDATTGFLFETFKTLAAGYVANIFNIPASELILNYTYINKSAVEMYSKIPSNCTPPQPFWGSYCSKQGVWLSSGDLVLSFPDVVGSITPVVHNGTLSITTTIQVNSELRVLDGLHISNKSTILIYKGSSITLQGQTDLDGNVTFRDFSDSDFENGGEFLILRGDSSRWSGNFANLNINTNISSKCFAFKRRVDGLYLYDACHSSSSAFSVNQLLYTIVPILICVFLVIFIIFIFTKTRYKKICFPHSDSIDDWNVEPKNYKYERM